MNKDVPLLDASTESATAAEMGTTQGAGRILVAVRKRPRLAQEQGEADVVDITDGRTVVIKETRLSLDGRKVNDQRGTYTFDFAFDENCSNALVYMRAVKPSLDVVRRGGNALFFAFGQTGSGKTHTMMGSVDASEHGLYVLAAQDIIAQLRGMRLSVSFYEIYGSKLFDLLNGRAPIQTLEDENKFIHLVGLTEHTVLDHGALVELMTLGSAQRSSGSTHVNDRSSRSHAVLSFVIRTRRDPMVFSRVSFVDLAGSERAQDTHDLDKKTRVEGAEINKSLLALKECVRALHEKKRHIPFRGSKLTQILRDSFSGNCVTVMFANVSPCMVHSDDTVNTLKYTNRIKELAPPEPNSTNVADLKRSVEPDLCEKCGFPILLDDRSLHVCPKQYVSCKFCKLEIVKTKMARHIQDCLEAPAACADCGIRGTRGQIALHVDKCPNPCALCSYCHTRIPKKTMDHHVVSECPGFKTACPHCRVVVARRELAEHSATCSHRQIACANCGFLVRQSAVKEHLKSCVAVSRRSSDFRNSFGKVPPTPSRLPPLSGLSPPRGSVLDRRTVPPPSRGAPHQTARRPGSKQHHLAVDVVAATARSGGKASHTSSPGRNISPEKASSPATTRVGVKPQSDIDAYREEAEASTGDVTDTFTAGTGSLPPEDGAVQGSATGATALPCEFGCGALVTSEEQPNHVRSCGSVVVPCPFVDVGCQVTITRSQLDAHVQGAVTAHLLLVHTNAAKLKRENEELRLKLAKVEHRIAQQEDDSHPPVHAPTEPPTSRPIPPPVAARILPIAATPAADDAPPPYRPAADSPHAVSSHSRTPQAAKREPALFHVGSERAPAGVLVTRKGVHVRPAARRHTTVAPTQLANK